MHDYAAVAGEVDLTEGATSPIGKIKNKRLALNDD
mgnify:CR=1 FL=1